MKCSAFLTSLCILVPLACSSVLRADTFTVANANDSGSGSLREAIAMANSRFGDDTIEFSNDVNGDTIILTSGQLTITDTAGITVIDALSLSRGVTISGNDSSRILQCNTGTLVQLLGLTLIDGHAPDGVNGISGDTPTNGADGEHGGAIHTMGGIFIDECVLRNNQAGDGGIGGANTGAADDFGASGGRGGWGGAIYARSQITIHDSTIENNRAGHGGRGGDSPTGSGGKAGSGGIGGYGGGLYATQSVLEMKRTILQQNEGGMGGPGGISSSARLSGTGSLGGDGGGGYIRESIMDLDQVTIRNNHAGDGGLGGKQIFTSSDTGGFGGDGGRGGGLAIYFLDTNGNPFIKRSSIYENRAGNGARGGASADGIGQNGTSGGDGGTGGGMYFRFSTGGSSSHTIQNTTISSNTSGAGGQAGGGTLGGAGGTGGNSGDSGGVDITSEGHAATFTFTHVTVTQNRIGDAGAGAFPDDMAGTSGEFGGIGSSLNNNVTVELANSVVSGNTAPTVADTIAFVSTGNNFTAGDAKLAPLADNGGPTKSHSFLTISPLLDGGAILGSPLTDDQRGKSRPSFGAPDIGAFEASAIQVDARIGSKRNPAKHRMNNIYTAGGGRPEKVGLKGRKASRYFVSVENDGDVSDSPLFRSNKPKRTLKVKVLRISGGRSNVTAAFRRGLLLADLFPQELVNFQIQVKSKSQIPPRQRLKYLATSQVAPTRRDAVKAKIATAK